MRAEAQAHVDTIKDALELLRRFLDWDRALRRLDELNARVEDQALWNDPKQAQAVMRERRRLDEAITATVITMGHSLGLNVIAEGVESEQQLSYLREQGCDEIQGFWLSPPLDSHRCLAFIRSWQPATVAAIPAPY